MLDGSCLCHICVRMLLGNELYEKLFAWYSGIATGLVSFATSTIAQQADRTIDDTMAGAKARLEEFETYKKVSYSLDQVCQVVCTGFFLF